ncbi:tRNA-uridine aminocarboxypropyltransferase [Algibacillus agarilyticus]|uniref:tRNA-uridine aminocarboxypropyltransferase n=1 Tax=Algibacillus agarilyticus TaxID=2234133 RepID=UPI000DCFFA94|nr:tRNA-uridine aminocarboxypropyltransferase [Algibacillus agarilyticus]
MARQICERCYRPQTVCYCSIIKRVDNPFSIRIIQHKLEQFKAKGTARLAELSLDNCDIEIVDPNVESWMLHAQDIVLFPTDDATILTSDYIETADLTNKRFVILDGTWRQANQLMRACQNRHKASFIALGVTDKSLYSDLRKTKKKGAFSTFEAITYLLADLGCQSSQISMLEHTFKHFLDFQLFIQKKNKHDPAI